jgi:hypothetical protein
MDDDIIESFSYEENINYNIEEYYLYTLNQIEKINDKNLRKEILKLYKNEIESMINLDKYNKVLISLLNGQSLISIEKNY